MTDEQLQALLTDCMRVSRGYHEALPKALTCKLVEAVLTLRVEVAEARREIANARHEWALEILARQDQDEAWQEVLAADEVVAQAVAALHKFRLR